MVLYTVLCTVNLIINMKNCKNCKKWSKMQDREGYGYCKSEKWNIHPSYFEDSDRVTEKDMVEVTYDPITGEDFGCVHHNGA